MSSIYDSQYDYDYLVFIGRYQPFHSAHKKIIDIGLTTARKVICLIGSSGKSRSVRNPWSWEERAQMIMDSYKGDESKRVITTPIIDSRYSDSSWCANVQNAVQGIIAIDSPTTRPKVGLIGHSKDQSSYYLKMFPQWGSVNVDNFWEINATDIRNTFFESNTSLAHLNTKFGDLIPTSTYQWLAGFVATDEFKKLKEEFEYIREYKSNWEGTPYPPFFVTTDAVVEQSGHVLLVKRKSFPGKGLWALPGGFVKEQERVRDCVVRELREETQLRVPAPVIAGNIQKQEVFDDPYRSDRGRVITHAFLINLPGQANGLPKVRGGSDASYAKWVPIADLKSEQLFEDHFDIIQAMLGTSIR